MSYSIIASAFEGFRLIVRRPVSFLGWCGMIGLIMAAVLLLQFALRGGVSSYVWGPGTFTPGGGLLAALLTLFEYLVGFSVLACAVYRAVLQPKERSFGYMRMGGVELRIMLIWTALAVIAFVMNFAIGFSVMVLGSLAGAWARPLIYLLCLLVAAALAVRLSLTGPVVLEEGRDSVAGSWELSKKRFWSLLGMWAIVAIVSILSIFLILVIIAALVTSVRTATGYNPSASIPVAVLSVVLTVLLFTFQAVLWAAPAAAAYQGLTRRTETPVEVFD